MNGTTGNGNTHGYPEPAEFDLRSDALTIPTREILEAGLAASFGDDVFQEDPCTEHLQNEMARLTGHEAGLFVYTATMGNQLALRALLTQPPHSVVIDYRSHVLHWEAGGIASLCGATLQPVEPKNKMYLMLDDVKRHVVLHNWVQNSQTKVIILENTLGGLVMPLDETQKISAFARQHNIKMHLDGARLFNVALTGAGTLPEYCKNFDTVTLCFSKGLGAPLGGILLGAREIIERARWIRQSIGGGAHQSGMLAAMAHMAFKRTFGGGIDGKGSPLEQSHEIARRIADAWVKAGYKLVVPTETNMVILDLEHARLPLHELTKMAAGHGLKINKHRIVVNYQTTDETVQRFERLITAISLRKIDTDGVQTDAIYGVSHLHPMELTKNVKV